MNLKNNEYWEKRADHYSKCFGKSTLPITANLISMINLSSAKLILDVGCGDSEEIIFISTQIQDPSILYGVDLCERMLELSIEKFKNFKNFNYNKDNSFSIIENKNLDKKLKVTDIKKYEKGMHINFIRGDCEDLPFENEQFDVCLSTECLQNSYNAEKAIKEMYRVLKKNGKFAFAIYGKKEGSIDEKIAKICGKNGIYINKFEFFKLSEEPNQLAKKMEKNGFREVKYQYTNTFISENEDVYYKMKLKKIPGIEKLREKNLKQAEIIENEIKKEIHKLYLNNNIPANGALCFCGTK